MTFKSVRKGCKPKVAKKNTTKSPSTGHTGAAAGALLCGAALLALTAAKRKHTEE